MQSAWLLALDVDSDDSDAERAWRRRNVRAGPLPLPDRRTSAIWNGLAPTCRRSPRPRLSAARAAEKMDKLKRQLQMTAKVSKKGRSGDRRAPRHRRGPGRAQAAQREAADARAKALEAAGAHRNAAVT